MERNEQEKASEQIDRNETDNDVDETEHNDSAIEMDDTTGSEGGIQQANAHDGGPYGSGYGTGSNGDDYSETSGTKRSGVSSDDDGLAGGRSQY